MKIYIVIGTSGEYSDRDEWLVKAYQSGTKAEEHVRQANEFAQNWRSEHCYPYLRDYSEDLTGWNPHDPENEDPQDEPGYFLQSVELDESA